MGSSCCVVRNDGVKKDGEGSSTSFIRVAIRAVETKSSYSGISLRNGNAVVGTMRLNCVMFPTMWAW